MSYDGRNRRKGSDSVTRTFHFLSFVCFFTNIAFLIILGVTKPPNTTMFDRMAGKTNFGGWNAGIVSALTILLAVQLILSLVGMYLNMLRHHRKRDRYSLTLIISAIVATGGLIILLI